MGSCSNGGNSMAADEPRLALGTLVRDTRRDRVGEVVDFIGGIRMGHTHRPPHRRRRRIRVNVVPTISIRPGQPHCGHLTANRLKIQALPLLRAHQGQLLPTCAQPSGDVASARERQQPPTGPG